MNLFRYFTPKAETAYLTADSTIRQALEKFDHHKFSVVPLIDRDGLYLSTVSEGDLLLYIKNKAGFDISAAENVLLTEVDKYRPYEACRSDVPMDEVIRLAMNQNFVPIVDDRGMYIGIVKRKAILDLLYTTGGESSGEKNT